MTKRFSNQSCQRRRGCTRMWHWLFLVGMFATFSGCSLFVMAGKMIFGDPLIVCDFTSQTHVNLQKEHKKVLVICSSPEAVKLHWPSLDYDILEKVSQNLNSRGIEVVNLDDVAHWIDDNGGEFDHPSELAEEFDADYIVHIELNEFRYLEEHSRDLYRGRANGNMMVYEVVRTTQGGEKRARAQQVFVQEFNSEYPSLQPIPSEQITDKSFRQKYLEEVSRELSRKLYNYRMEDTF